jgi:PKD repeat protein
LSGGKMLNFVLQFKTKPMKTSLLKTAALVMLLLGTQAFSQCNITAFASYVNNGNGNYTFVGTSSGSGAPVYTWLLSGPGVYTTANGSNLNYTFYTTGTYTAALYVNDSLNGGCIDSAFVNVQVTTGGTGCNASFNYSYGSGGQVNFNNTSAVNLSGPTYFWDFGDGNTSSAVSPTHTYQFNGTYAVSLTISSGGVVYCTYSQNVTITNGTPCTLSASFTYTLGAGGSVNFTNTSTGTSSAMFYSWSFGDGSYSNLVSPSYTYAYNGTYGVGLYAIDSISGCASYDSASITITGGLSTPTCTASFTYTPGSNGLVSFTGTAPGTLTNPQYYWTFGDGAGAGTSAPNHTYSQNGVYTVTFYAYDTLNSNWGCSATQQVTISNSVNCNDSAYFYLYQDSSQVATWFAYLYATNVNQLINAVWSWGDGTSSTGLFPSHTYAQAGWYNICVTAYFSCGDTSYYCSLDSIYKSAGQMVNVQVVNGVSVVHSAKGQFSAVKAYPNPFADELTIAFVSTASQVINCTLTDVMGNVVLKQQAEARAGDGQLKLSTGALAKGAYFLTLQQEGKSSTVKVIK